VFSDFKANPTIENVQKASPRSKRAARIASSRSAAVFAIAVPTTAGTAAEVTFNYVIPDGGNAVRDRYTR
jgi:alcohol dehydrogenase class IV